MSTDRIIEKNLCGGCRHCFDDYSSGEWENGCLKGSTAVAKDGGLTTCTWWEAKP